MENETLLYSGLSEVIIGSAMKVLNVLKPGLGEKAYENALVIELLQRGVRANQQSRFNVLYDGLIVDTLIPDLIVADTVIVDTKVAEGFTASHTSQMLGYLTVTKLRLALLLNFKFADLRWHRVVR